jgi:TPR repeat protein
LEWFTRAAEAGLPKAIYNVAGMLDSGKGRAAPDYPAAVEWYRRAADAGVAEVAAEAAHVLSSMYMVGRGRPRR